MKRTVSSWIALSVALAGLGAARDAFASPSRAPVFGWEAPPAVRAFQWQKEEHARDLSGDGEITAKAGELIAIPVDAGDRIRLEGDVAGVGFGSGAGAIPDVVTWLLDSEIQPVEGAISVAVPAWSSADALVIRPGASGKLRVVMAMRESAPLLWHRFDEELFARLTEHPGSPFPVAPIEGAEPILRWLAAAERALASEPREFVAPWLMARWIDASMRFRPLMQPYFVDESPRVVGGARATGVADVDRATSWTAATSGTISLEGSSVDVARIALVARRKGKTRVLVREGSGVARVISWSTPARLASTAWTDPQWIRAVFPAGDRKVSIEVIEGEVAVAAIGFRHKTDLFDAFAQHRDRDRLFASAGARKSGAHVVALDLLEKAARGVALPESVRTNDAWWANAGLPSEPSFDAFRALLLGEVATRATDATTARGGAVAMVERLRTVEPEVSGPLGRLVLEHVARVISPSDAIDGPLVVPAAAHPDDLAACAAAAVVRATDEQRPTLGYDAETYAREHGESFDAATRARRTWASEAPWQSLDVLPSTRVQHRFAAPQPDARTPGACRVRTDRGLRWSLVREAKSTIKIAPSTGTHARVAMRSETIASDVSLRVDGLPITLHAASGLWSFVALAPGDHVVEKTGDQPVLVRYPREDELPCDELREVQTWARVEPRAEMSVPAPGRPTVAQIVVDGASLAQDGTSTTVRVLSGSTAREAWVRGAASGQIEMLVAPSQTLVAIEADRAIDVRAMARLHPPPAPPVREVSRPADASAGDVYLSQLRAASKIIFSGPDSARSSARERRRQSLESLGFHRLASLDAPMAGLTADPRDDEGVIVESVALPAGAPATVPLGWVGQVAPMPAAPVEPAIANAVERLAAGDLAGALALVKAIDPARADAAVLLQGVVAERAGDHDLALRAIESLARSKRSGAAFAHAASLAADVALDHQDPKLVLRGVALAQLAVDAGDPAIGAIARLAPAHAYSFPSQVDSSAGFATIATGEGSRPEPTPGELVRRAWSDAPDGASLLSEGAQLRAFLTRNKNAKVVVTSRCVSIDTKPSTCALSVLVDGEKVTCPAPREDGIATCEVAVKQGKHRLDVVAPAQPETIAWATLHDTAEARDLSAASLVRWSELDTARPFEVVVKGPTVVSLHARVDPGAPRSLSIVDRVTGSNDPAPSTTWDLVTERDPDATRVVGQGTNATPVSKESIRRIALLEPGVHRIRVSAREGHAFVRVAVATPTGLPRPRAVEPVVTRPAPTFGESMSSLGPAAPEPVFDRTGLFATIGASALYANSNLFQSDSADLTAVSSKSLTQFGELQGRIQREVSENIAWAGLTAFGRLRDGPSSGGAFATFDMSPHGYIPGVFALGQATFQKVPGKEARGFSTTLEAYGAIPVMGDLRLTPLAAFVFNGVDRSARGVSGADPDVYTIFNETHPRHATLGARLAWKPFLDTIIKPQFSVRTMPDYVQMDRYELRVDIDTLPGHGYFPWLGVTWLLSDRPTTADRSSSFVRNTFQARATAWTWVSGAHRVSLAALFQYLFDTPTPQFSQPPFSGSLTLSYDFADARGLRDFPSRLVPFRDRMEEGSNRVHRVEPSVDPSWGIP